MGSCPICDGGDSCLRFVVRRQPILVCRGCGGYFLGDAPSPDVAPPSARYAHRYLCRGGADRGDARLTGYYDYEADLRLHLRNFRRNLRIVKLHARGERLLDLGCASGHFLVAAAQAGFRVAGADVSEAAIAQASARLECRTWAGDLATLDVDERFDVVTMWETIEHLAEPRPVLGKVRTWLERDGVLVVGTGDSASLVARAMGRRWWYLNPPDHAVYYNRRALGALLERNGFRIEAWHRVHTHWVSSRNALMKLLRSVDFDPARALAWVRRVPDVPLPIVHGTTMVVAARPA